MRPYSTMTVGTLYYLEAEHRRLADQLRLVLLDIVGDRNFAGAFAARASEIERISSNLSAVETTIRLLDDEWTPDKNPLRRKYSKRSPFGYRQLRGHIYGLIRSSEDWWTVRCLAEEIMDRHLPERLSNEDRYNLQRAIWSQMCRDEDSGLVERRKETIYEEWKFIPKEKRQPLDFRPPASKAASAA